MQSPSWRSTPCPVCGGAFRRLAFGGRAKADHVFPECGSCGHAVAWKNGFVVDDYSEYGEGYVVPPVLLAERLAEVRKLVQPLLAAIPGERPRCLEVGAGGGFFARVAKDRGWDVVAMEPSAVLRRFGQEQLGVDYITDLEQAEGLFDVTALLDVIEHLHPLEVPKVLSQIHGKLRPGGLLFGITPNLRSLNLRLAATQDPAVVPPAHAAHFTPRSLNLALSASGFRPRKVWTEGVHVAALFNGWRRLSFLHQPLRRTPARLLPLALPLKAGGRLLNRLLPRAAGLGYTCFFVAERS